MAHTHSRLTTIYLKSDNDELPRLSKYYMRGENAMNTSITFNCEKCGYPLQANVTQTEETVVCSKCGYENTVPKSFTLPDSANIKVKKIYFGD